MEADQIGDRRQRRFRAMTLGFVLALIAFGLTDVRRRARVDPDRPDVHRTDLTIFSGAGAAFLADDEPYAHANPRGWKYAYPPLCALALSPLAGLGPQAQAVIWFALSCLCAWLGWREAVRISARLGIDVRLSPVNSSPGRELGWAAVAAASLPALNCLQRGQVGLLYVWLLLWGYRLLIESANWRGALAGGVVLSLPGVIKVTPALPAVAAIGMWSVAHWRWSHPRRTATSLSLRSDIGDVVDRRPEARVAAGWMKGLARLWSRFPGHGWPPHPGPLPGTAVEAQQALLCAGEGGRMTALAGVAGLGFGAVLFLFLVPAGILGWEANLRHLRTWTTTIATMAAEVDPSSTLETPYTVRNQSLSNAVYRCGNWFDYALLGGPDDRAIDALPYNPDHHLAMDDPWVGRVVLTLRLLLLGLLGIAGWTAARSREPRRMTAVFGLACVASLIVSPLSRGHYFVMLLPGVLWGTATSRNASPQRLRWMLWSPAILTLMHYVLLDQAGRIGLLGLGITIWFVVAAVRSQWTMHGSTSDHDCAAPPVQRQAA